MHSTVADPLTPFVRRFPSKNNPLPPVPGADLSTEVLGRAASIEEFLFGGFVVSEGIRDILNRLGRPLESFSSVLDFGCGSARVLRWFEDFTVIEWFGSDISEDAIAWNRRNLSFGEFTANGVEPPLPFPEHSFDLIFGVSVLTHLDERLQFAWLSELRRVLRPGGLLLLTVSCENVARWKLAPAEFSAFQKHGHRYQRVQVGGLHGLPDFYQDAYHTYEYVTREWTRFFEPIAWFRNGPMYLQDFVVLKNDAAGGECIQWQFPLGAFWTPRIADVVSTGSLTVTGWTFKHDSGPVALHFEVNGVRLGEPVVANLPTPGVAGVFPIFPSAGRCGFSCTLTVAHLAPGPHVLKMVEKQSAMPYVSTYFFVAPADN